MKEGRYTEVFNIKEIKNSILIAVWFMILTFPIMVIRVNTITNTIEWRWGYLAAVGVGTFFLSLLWKFLLARRELGRTEDDGESGGSRKPRLLSRETLSNRKLRLPVLGVLALFIVLFPFIMSMYQTNIMITALIYVMLGLGLNIVVGLGGLLNLGYIAFFAVGAYGYALLNRHFDVSFWAALPLGAVFALLFGVLLGVPVLRLRGDYLAIVTLAFGEITRIVLENWTEFSEGPKGIANIDRPSLFGMRFALPEVTVFTYFLMIALTLLTIFIVHRLENSRVGRAWVAMREDEVASQAMGIDTTKAKITAFALGALWAGLAGVMYAAKTTYVNPGKFSVWESILVLASVVLGGMGSIPGVIIAALVLALLPEYLRAFSEYRMLIYGLSMVVIMVFRPEGLIGAKRKAYVFEQTPSDSPAQTGDR